MLWNESFIKKLIILYTIIYLSFYVEKERFYYFLRKKWWGQETAVWLRFKNKENSKCASWDGIYKKLYQEHARLSLHLRCFRISSLLHQRNGSLSPCFFVCFCQQILLWLFLFGNSSRFTTYWIIKMTLSPYFVFC